MTHRQCLAGLGAPFAAAGFAQPAGFVEPIVYGGVEFKRTRLHLHRNNRCGTFTGVARQAGLARVACSRKIEVHRSVKGDRIAKLKQGAREKLG